MQFYKTMFSSMDRSTIVLRYKSMHTSSYGILQNNV